VIYAAALAAVACFIIAFERLGVVAVARGAMRSALDASRVMRDARLSDEEKERAVRASSLVLLRSFGSITIRSAAALAISLLPVLALQAAGLAALPAVNRLLLSWQGLLLASVTVAVAYLARTRL